MEAPTAEGFFSSLLDSSEKARAVTAFAVSAATTARLVESSVLFNKNIAQTFKIVAIKPKNAISH
jgi:hypothetical protein